MKKLNLLYTVFLILYFNPSISAQIELSTQAEVDAWDQSITDLTEDVIINGSDITNIDAFSMLTDIQSKLEIISNPVLTNIDGLSGLKKVSGSINIYNNDSLTNIDCFLSLKDVEGSILLQINDGLTNINGFSNLENVTGKIFLVSNKALSNIDGFSGLEDFSGTLAISGSDALNNLNGFSNLTNFSGTIELNDNDALTNLNIFSNYTDIIGNLTIKNCDAIPNLDSFSSLTDISGALNICGISSLTNLNFLSKITSLSGDLRIRNCQNLISIDGLSDLSIINGSLFVIDNNKLENINGLSSLVTINGKLEIISNEQLKNINILSSLADINGELEINDNDSLLDLDFLSNYTNITGSIIIEDNDGLTNLDALSNLTQLTGSIVIQDNISIADIDAFSMLSNVAGILTVQSNDNLSNINGLSNLLDVTGRIIISENNELIDLNGFSGLENITGRLDISGNNGLEGLEGLSNLSNIDGGLYISWNDGLTNIDGLSTLSSINGSLVITNNISLINIDGLSGVLNITKDGKVEIDKNSSLINIDGLSGLVSLDGNLFIEENSSLLNIDGLSVLTEISSTSDIRISQNHALTNIDGFSNVKNVNRKLLINNNNGISTMDGLSQIEEISSLGHLEITNNANLGNIDGLSGLRRVIGSGRLTIQNNDGLTNLDGLYGLENTTGRIIILDNDLLSNCCGLSDAIENGELQDFAIDTNRIGCNNIDEILDACSLTLLYDLLRPCEGLDNGRINFFASDYDAIPFSYQWEEIVFGDSGNGISDSDNFSIHNLGAGTYNVTVTLPNGARESVHGIVIDPIEGSIFEITKLTSTNSINGIPSGNIYIEYSGGTAPYALDWIGPNSGNRSDISTKHYTMFGLGAGEYSVQLTDADGQSKIIDIILLDNDVPVFPCSEPLDLVILNDVSGSVDEVEYDESKSFFIDFLKAANIGDGAMESQACIIEWSSNPQQRLIVPLTGNIAELENYENATRAFSDGTAPHPAMQYGYDYIKINGTVDVEKVLILSTDGFPSPSLIALADEFKAEGYHIITIAFDDAYERGNIRDILTLVASVPLLASGAPAYSDLDADLADDIVNLYLCPLDPGESSSVYFNRDGAIKIDSAVGACPVPDFVDLTFTVSAYRELSIPAGTSVMFYHNNPLLFSASPILDFRLPCAIPTGTSESHTVTLPINVATKLYVLLNDDGSITPPLNFPITDLKEIAYSNNIDTVSVCINKKPTLQALKYTTTPTPICDSILMYTIDVCNIGTTDAYGVVVTDDAPEGTSLIAMMVNDNVCAIDNGGMYDIPVDCCVSISLTYNASEVSDGYYGAQNVELSGPINQEYLDYDGSQSSSEDVTIEEGIENCSSTKIWITKDVNTDQACEDDFLIYTYTIHNETNSVIHGARFIDVLPEPMEWVYKPYLMNGLSINTQQLSGRMADFIIDEIPADTVATFQIDAYTGDFLSDGVVSSTALLENVIDLETGGTQTLESNSVTTIVYENSGATCDSIWTDIKVIEPLKTVILFPNPTNGTIQFKNINESVNYKLLNTAGLIYEEGKYSGGELVLSFDGVNLVQLIVDDQVKTFKVLKISRD